MTDLTPWNRFGSADYGPSYRVADTRPNLIDALEESWAMPSARAATPTGLSRLRRLRASIASLSRQAISGDCFYLISGAMVALDLVLVIWLVRR